MNRAVNDDALSRCVCEAAEAMLSALPAPKDCDHVFSPAFEAKMEQLLAQVRRREQWQRLARSAAAVFLAVVLGSGVFLSINAEARDSFFSWFTEDNGTSITYYAHGPYDPDYVLPDFEFTWLPEGYAVSKQDGSEDMRIIVCNDLDSDTPVFLLSYHYCIGSTHTTLLFGESDYTHRSAKVNGMDADIYLCNDGSSCNNLLWFDEERDILWDIQAYLDADTMLKIARGIALAE